MQRPCGREGEDMAYSETYDNSTYDFLFYGDAKVILIQ